MDLHTDPSVGPLFDVGPRRHRRLFPTPQLPATASIRSPSGWSTPERPVADISLGGLSLRLGFWQGRRVVVGEVVTVVLDLAGRRYALNARTMHVSRNRESLLGDYLCGLKFEEDRTFRAYWTILRDYLLQIVTEPS